MNAPWFAFILGVFATWRVAHLLAHEDGPWDSVLRLRVALGNGVWGRLLDCFHCVSLWWPRRSRWPWRAAPSSGCWRGWDCRAPPACSSG